MEDLDGEISETGEVVKAIPMELMANKTNYRCHSFIASN